MAAKGASSPHRAARRRPKASVSQSGPFGYFSFPTFTGDANNPEVFVKVLEPSPGKPWVFYSGLTNLDVAGSSSMNPDRANLIRVAIDTWWRSMPMTCIIPNVMISVSTTAWVSGPSGIAGDGNRNI